MSERSMNDEKCPDCRHPWVSHQRANGPTGHRCRYNQYGQPCGCITANPHNVAEDRLAADAWNNFMGR